MKNELIPLYHQLGLLQAVWLHYERDKVLTVLRKGRYQNWAYENNEMHGWSVVLLTNGKFGTFPGFLTHWTYFE